MSVVWNKTLYQKSIKMTIERARELLGELAENMSDEEVEKILIDSRRLIEWIIDAVENETNMAKVKFS